MRFNDLKIGEYFVHHTHDLCLKTSPYEGFVFKENKCFNFRPESVVIQSTPKEVKFQILHHSLNLAMAKLKEKVSSIEDIVEKINDLEKEG